MVNCNSQNLVTATVLNNYATYSAWKDRWVSLYVGIRRYASAYLSYA